MKIHPSLTLDVVMDAVERQNTTTDNPGFCIACGAENEGAEPDARGNECEACGTPRVYGAEELLFHIGA